MFCFKEALVTFYIEDAGRWGRMEGKGPERGKDCNVYQPNTNRTRLYCLCGNTSHNNNLVQASGLDACGSKLTLTLILGAISQH